MIAQLRFQEAKRCVLLERSSRKPFSRVAQAKPKGVQALSAYTSTVPISLTFMVGGMGNLQGELEALAMRRVWIEDVSESLSYERQLWYMLHDPCFEDLVGCFRTPLNQLTPCVHQTACFRTRVAVLPEKSLDVRLSFLSMSTYYSYKSFLSRSAAPLKFDKSSNSVSSSSDLLFHREPTCEAHLQTSLWPSVSIERDTKLCLTLLTRLKSGYPFREHF